MVIQRETKQKKKKFFCVFFYAEKKKKSKTGLFFLKIPLTFLYVFLISFWGWAHAHTVQFTSLCVREAQSINISVTNNSLFFFLQRELTRRFVILSSPSQNTHRGRPWSFFPSSFFLCFCVSEPGIKILQKKKRKERKKRINDSNRSWPATIKSLKSVGKYKGSPVNYEKYRVK